MLGALLRWTARTFLSRDWLTLQGIVLRHALAVQVSPPSDLLVRMLVSGEDHRHGQHAGYDIRAIARAFVRTVFLRRTEGASTIEQQIVRVLTGRYERTLRRKLRELMLAALVAQSVPKRYLPAVYLRIGYFGADAVGVEAACKAWGYLTGSLTPRNAATIIACLKYPLPRHPSPQRLEKIAHRAQHVLALFHRHSLEDVYAFLSPFQIPNQPDECWSRTYPGLNSGRAG